MHLSSSSSSTDVSNGRSSFLDASKKTVRLTITSHHSPGRCNSIDPSYYSSSPSTSASEASSPQTPTHYPLLLMTGPAPDDYLQTPTNNKPTQPELLFRSNPSSLLLLNSTFNKSQHRKSWHGYTHFSTPPSVVTKACLNMVEVEFYQPPSSPSDAGELTRTSSVSSMVSSSAYSSAAEDSSSPAVPLQRRRSSFLKRLKNMMLRPREVTPTSPPAWYVQLTTAFALSTSPFFATNGGGGNSPINKRKNIRLAAISANNRLLKEQRHTEYEDEHYRYALLIEATTKPYPLEVSSNEQPDTPYRTCHYCGGILTKDECTNGAVSMKQQCCADCQQYNLSVE